ncbi:MAG: succinylglutamate desuccinylase/aspartoacylase family protein, partial [Mailhella sp.]|nr:succinylglutamate desuccinylase/aspartoacylase family protein [Mailhella sp.]
MSEVHCFLSEDLTPGKHFFRLPVTTILSGPLSLGLHVVVGTKPGPTLGVTGCVHGDETVTVFGLKKWLDSLRVEELAGRVAVIPAANPTAIQLFNRQTPEQHGNTDLHTVFPGNPEKGNLTSKLAVTICKQLLDHVDAYVDIHSGSAARLQNRSDFHNDLAEPLRQQCIDLCRAFGAPFIHAN